MPLCPHCGKETDPINQKKYDARMNHYESPSGERAALNATDDLITLKNVVWTRVDQKTGLKVVVDKKVEPKAPAATPITPNAPSGSTVTQVNTSTTQAPKEVKA